jgi:hypothetical protein
MRFLHAAVLSQMGGEYGRRKAPAAVVLSGWRARFSL